MRVFRYPIEPLSSPITGAVSPVFVPFDFLPLSANTPFSSEDELRLYKTKIVIRAAAAEAGMSRIQHVFPKSSVFIRVHEPFDMNADALAQQYINSSDADIPSLRATWVTLGWPEDIRSLREDLAIRVVPTVIIFHNVIIDKQVVVESVFPRLQTTKVMVGPKLERTELKTDEEKLTAWLKGETKVLFDNNDLSPILPQIHPISPDNPSSDLVMEISSLMMDGAAAGLDTLPTILDSIEGTTVAVSDSVSEPMLVSIPLSQFLSLIPPAKLDASHINHPLKFAWPSPPANWSAIVFSFSDSPRPEVTTLRPDPDFALLECKIGIDWPKPIPSSGLFFFRSPDIQTDVEVTDAVGIKQTLSILKLGLSTPVVGVTIRVEKDRSFFGFHKLYIGKVSSASGDDKYLGIPAELGNLQQVIDALALRLGTTMSWAACFARLMGFIAEAVAKHLEIHKVDGTSILPTASFKQFIATAAELIVSDEVKSDEWIQEITVLYTYTYDVNDKVDTILTGANIDLSEINRVDWINTHNDDQNSNSGWKTFGKLRDGGHQDHFLTNAFVRMDRSNIVYNFGSWVTHESGDDDKIDLQYNECGEEFAEWGASAKFKPEAVEQWLIEKLVARATPAPSSP